MGVFRFGDGNGDHRLLTGAAVRSFEHVEGRAIVVELKTEDEQQAKATEEVVIMPETAAALARALLAALVRMGHGFGGEEPTD